MTTYSDLCKMARMNRVKVISMLVVNSHGGYYFGIVDDVISHFNKNKR